LAKQCPHNVKHTYLNILKRVLITGGSGLVGMRLSWHLQNLGYKVTHLSHSKPQNPIYPTYFWNPAKNEIEEAALTNTDAIVHLAGANVGAGRWTEKRKKQILDSRVLSGQCLYDALKKYPNQVKRIICASATGYYPQTQTADVYTELSEHGYGFLYEVVAAWEATAELFKQLQISTAVVRIGVVLSTKGGALPKLVTPVKYFLGSPLGSGTQMLPWIHIDDLCRTFTWLLKEDHLTGTFNAAAPNAVSNAEATRLLGKILNRKIWLPNVPAFIIQLLFGEMSVLVLKGCVASPAKLEQTGYKFIHPTFEKAVTDLIKRNI
jgi:uncharacterized protein (TIGR01777 family)